MLGQYSQNSLEYTKAMIPVIVQLGLMLLVVVVVMMVVVIMMMVMMMMVMVRM